MAVARERGLSAFWLCTSVRLSDPQDVPIAKVVPPYCFETHYLVYFGLATSVRKLDTEAAIFRSKPLCGPCDGKRCNFVATIAITVPTMQDRTR